MNSNISGVAKLQQVPHISQKPETTKTVIPVATQMLHEFVAMFETNPVHPSSVKGRSSLDPKLVKRIKSLHFGTL
ncbi:hypothetical protein AAC387_Pa01g1057 [Persea americana]